MTCNEYEDCGGVAASVEGPVVVAALYHFAPIYDVEGQRAALAKLACAQGVKGTLLVAREGINGTIAGTRAGIDTVVGLIRAVPGFEALEVKESSASTMPFNRLKVRIKSEIVTMGRSDIDPRGTVGTYVAAEDWNELISRDDVVVIDTRNAYEVEIGTFANAVDPGTDTFREFPKWVEDNLDPGANTKIAMFCTGGIRCEKATALLKQMGFPEVFHLKGGILRYLETVPAEESLWKGECFVFDQRVSVGHGLVPGPFQLCSICRKPFGSGDGAGGYANAPCPSCEQEASAERKDRARERQKQIDLAEARGHSHIGQGAATVWAPRKNNEGGRR